PSIKTGVLIAGKGERGAIVCTPGPGMSKSIALVAPTALLESRIAWRIEPGPLSPVFVTRKVDSTVRSSSHSKRRTIRRAPLGEGGGVVRRRPRGTGRQVRTGRGRRLASART